MKFEKGHKTNVGRPCPLKTREKIRIAQLGKHYPKKSEAAKRRKHTPESKENIRLAKLGITLSEVHKKNIGVGLIGNKNAQGYVHSDKSKQKNSKSGIGINTWTKNKLGVKSSNWQGGITSLNKIIRGSDKYTNWRSQVFGRDHFTCQECGIRGEWLEVHHIESLSVIIKENYLTKNNYIDCIKLWDLNNGKTYCKKCHDLLNKKGGLVNGFV